MWNKEKLRGLKESDLIELAGNQIAENRTIEYKVELNLNGREEKREFLADVCSFANAQGGNLFIGISTNNGIPTSIDGVLLSDVDGEILKMENLIRDSIEPRIVGIEIFPIKLNNGNTVLIIYIPNSYIKPHIVNYSGHWRFYSRNSAGKYPLDLSEVKTAIVKADSQEEKIKKFHLERFNKILANDISVSMGDSAKVILHLIPIQSFGDRNRFDIINYLSKGISPKPLSSSGWNHKINFDGFMSYAGMDNDQKIIGSYVQFYKDGTIEVVDSAMLDYYGQKKIIPTNAFEGKIISGVTSYLKILRELEVPPPFVFMLSIYGVQDFMLGVDNSRFWNYDTKRIDRNDLIIPEVYIEDYSSEIDKEIRPVFDAIWNAAGWDFCMNYNSDGKWGK